MENNSYSYNLEKDIDNGLIEVYSPNYLNDKFTSYQDLKSTARLHAMNPLEAANNMMSMYSFNYARRNPQAKERVNKWSAYYSTVKDKKKYKCSECGWKGKITEMADGIWHDNSCPECNNDFDLEAIKS